MSISTRWIKRLRRRESYSREVLDTFATNMAIAGVNMLSGVLLARLLGPGGRGELAAIQALPMILGSFGALGLSDAVIYFGGRDRQQVGVFSASAVPLAFLVATPMAILAALAMPYFLAAQSTRVVHASQWYLLIVFVNVIHGISINISRALHNIRLWNKLRTVSPVLWATVAAAFFVAARPNPVAIPLAYLVVLLAASITMLRSLPDHVRRQWRPKLALWPRMLRYGLPLALGAAPNVMNQRVDQLLIAGLLSPAQLGFYAVAVSWAGLAILPSRAMIGVTFSKVAGLAARDAQLAHIRKASVGAIVVTTLAVVGLALLAPLVIPLAFGPEFRPVSKLAAILLVACIPRALSDMVQVGMKAMGYTTVVLYAEWVALGVLVVGLLVLIPRFQAVGAATALVTSAVTACLVSLLVGIRRVRSSPLGG